MPRTFSRNELGWGAQAHLCLKACVLHPPGTHFSPNASGGGTNPVEGRSTADCRRQALGFTSPWPPPPSPPPPPPPPPPQLWAVLAVFPFALSPPPPPCLHPLIRPALRCLPKAARRVFPALSKPEPRRSHPVGFFFSSICPLPVTRLALSR